MASALEQLVDERSVLAVQEVPSTQVPIHDPWTLAHLWLPEVAHRCQLLPLHPCHPRHFAQAACQVTCPRWL
jgi:hypothetical protein